MLRDVSHHRGRRRAFVRCRSALGAAVLALVGVVGCGAPRGAEPGPIDDAIPASELVNGEVPVAVTGQLLTPIDSSASRIMDRSPEAIRDWHLRLAKKLSHDLRANGYRTTSRAELVSEYRFKIGDRGRTPGGIVEYLVGCHQDSEPFVVMIAVDPAARGYFRVHVMWRSEFGKTERQETLVQDFVNDLTAWWALNGPFAHG